MIRLALLVGGIYQDSCRPEEDGTSPVLPPTWGEADNSLNAWILTFGFGFLFFAGAYVVTALSFPPPDPDVEYTEAERAQFHPNFSRAAHAVGLVLYMVFYLGMLVSGGVLLFGNAGTACKTSSYSNALRVYQTAMALWGLLLISLGCITCSISVVSCAQRRNSQQQPDAANASGPIRSIPSPHRAVRMPNSDSVELEHSDDDV